jgi:hypothetical protein
MIRERLKQRGADVLRRAGWRVKQKYNGRKSFDVVRWPLDDNLTLIKLEWRRDNGWRLRAEGDFLQIQLKLAEFFEILFCYTVVDNSTQS